MARNMVCIHNSPSINSSSHDALTKHLNASSLGQLNPLQVCCSFPFLLGSMVLVAGMSLHVGLSVLLEHVLFLNSETSGFV